MRLGNGARYLRGVFAEEYVVLSVEFKNLVLVRRDLAAFFATGLMHDAGTKWRAGWFCNPVARSWRRFEERGRADFRAFVDPALTGEQRLQRVGSWLEKEFECARAARPSWAGNSYSLELT